MGLYIMIKEIFRPPLLIFGLTVIALAVTLFTYSLSLQVKDKNILNPDIRSWNLFFKSISSLGVCLMPKILKSSKTNILNASLKDLSNADHINKTNVSFLAETVLVIDNNIQTGYYVHVTVKGEELGYPRSKELVDMVITYPKHGNNQRLSCVTIVGPLNLLPNIEIKLPTCIQPKISSNSIRDLVLMPASRLIEKDSCPQEHIGTLTFKEKEILNVYLSKLDTSLIQMHIFVMSSVLCSIVFLFFLYCILRKVCKTDKKLFFEDETNSFLVQKSNSPVWQNLKHGGRTGCNHMPEQKLFQRHNSKAFQFNQRHNITTEYFQFDPISDFLNICLFNYWINKLKKNL